MSPREVESRIAGLGEVPPEDWEATPESVRRLVVTLLEQLERIKKLEQEVADLKEKLGANSRNSSLPPSSDRQPPKTRAERRRSERKRGAQPGHEGKFRELLPPEEVDRIVDCPPDRCQCGGRVRVDREQMERRQVWELPAVSTEVTEYRLYWGQCERCENLVCGELPPEAGGEGMLGARAMAVVALLTGKFRLSKRAATEALQDLFGLEVCDGTICNTEQRVAAVLEQPVEEAKAYVQAQPVVHADETGWRLGNKRAWLWTALTATVSVFVLRTSRGAKIAKELLGEAFRGILVSDRYSAYSWVAAAHRQVCWSHLLRDFEKIAERGGESAEIGNALLFWAAEMFSLWDRFKTAAISRATLRQNMAPIRSMIIEVLELGTACAHSKTANTCREILDLRRALWTFVRVEGVEPTNNAAERTIRPAVMWRKTSFGTDSEAGARFVERILTVTATCRQQGRNPLEFIHHAIIAAFSNRPAPSLLPAT